MRKELIITIIAFVANASIALIAVLLGRSLDSFIYYIIPTIFVLIFFILVTNQNIKMRKDIYEELNKIKSISYNYELIMGNHKVNRVLIEAINEAQGFLFTTGGRSRESEYLNAISQKIIKNKIKYYRVILGNHIHEIFYKHLNSLFSSNISDIFIGYIKDEKYGNMLVTDKKVIFYLPSDSEGLDSVLRIEDSNLAQKYQLYIMQIYANSEKINSATDLHELYHSLIK
jgi:hypothetical protein